MKKKIAPVLLASVLLNSAALYAQSFSFSENYTIAVIDVLPHDSVTYVDRKVDYTIRNSLDMYGNLYIMAWSQHPSVLTFLNHDGAVTVCTSDDTAKITHIYEYDMNLKETGALSFKNESGSLGAFTKDADGNYYFFYAALAAGQNAENMAVVKYDREGVKINEYKLKAMATDSFGGAKIPFDAGTCRMELSDSMLIVYFAREKFNGHQASYGFMLDKDTFKRIDRGQVSNNRQVITGNNVIPYVSHSFNQFVLPIDNGFLFADHGDGYPRAFTFSKFQNGSATRKIDAFRFPGGTGFNPTYAEMGGLAKTQGGYIFSGTYGKVQNSPRNLFVLTFDDNLTKCSAPIYLTNYTKESGHAGHPKIVALDNGNYLLLWELFGFSTHNANTYDFSLTDHLSTFALIINENGEPVSDILELGGIRLNINDTLRYNPRNNKVYWAINNSKNSLVVYALDTGFLQALP